MRLAIVMTVVLIGCCLASRSAEDAPTTLAGDQETTTEPADEAETAAAMTTSAEVEAPVQVSVDPLDPNIALARVARDASGWQGSWTRNEGFERNGGLDSAKQNGGFGNSDQNGGFGHSNQNGGFGNSNQNGGFGHSDQNGGFGNSNENGGFDYEPGRGLGYGKPGASQGFSAPSRNQGFGNPYQSQRFGKPYERKPFGIDNYYRLIRPSRPEPPRRRNDVPRIPATRKPFRVYPVFPG